MNPTLAIAMASGLPAAAAGFVPLPETLRPQGAVKLTPASAASMIVFAAAASAALWAADAPAVAGPLVAAGAAVTAAELAEGRIPHAVSVAAAVPVAVIAFMQSTALAAATAAICLLAAGWAFGRGPLGGVSAAGRAMQGRGRPLLVGGGDPAWLAVTAAAAAAAAAHGPGRVSGWVLPEGGLLAPPWQHAWMTVCAVMFVTGVLSAAGAVLPPLRGETKNRFKMGPAAAVAAVLVVSL